MNFKSRFAIVAVAFCLTACLETENSNSKRANRPIAKDSTEEIDAPPTAQNLACAKQTCGEAKSLPYITAPFNEIDKTLFKSNIEQLLNTYIQTSIQYFNIKNKIANQTATIQIDYLSDSYQALLNYLEFSRFSKQITKSISETNFGIRVNAATLANELKKSGTTNPQLISWISLVATQIYESDLFSSNYFLSQAPFEVFVRRNYPGYDLLLAISLEAQKLLKIQEKIISTFPILKIRAAGTIAILNKAIRKQPLDPDEQQTFIEDRLSLLILNEFLPEGEWRKVILQYPIDFRKTVAQLIEKSKRSNLNQITNQMLKRQEQDQLLMCNYYLMTAIASSPTEEQNSYFSRITNDLKKEAASIINSSRYNTPNVLSSIEKVKIVLPPPKAQMSVALARLLQNKIISLNENIQRLSQFDIRKQEDKEIYVLLLASQYADEDANEDPDEVLGNVKEFCADNSADSISDSTYTSYQLINIGWRSVIFPEYGYGIAAHEMGHVISAADQMNSRQEFSRVKTCLKLNQKNTDTYVEEDFADTFAIQMMKKKNYKVSNYSCLLLDQDGSEYTSLRLTAKPGADHSSSFYRLLHVGSEIGDLAPSCAEAKNSLSNGQMIRSCWGQ